MRDRLETFTHLGELASHTKPKFRAPPVRQTVGGARTGERDPVRVLHKERAARSADDRPLAAAVRSDRPARR